MAVRKTFALLSLVLAGAVIAACSSEKAADTAPSAGAAGSQAEPAAGQGAAAADAQVPDDVTVAAILLFENRTRCMRVATQGSAIIAAWTELNPNQTPPGFGDQLRTETGDDLALAQVVGEEVARIYRELRGRRDLWQSSSLEAVSGMYRAQTSLCDQVIRPAPSVDAYESSIRTHVQSFDQAAAKLEIEYRPAAGERDYVARKYDGWFRNLLVAQRSGAAGESSPGFDSDVPDPAAPISADEYRRKQEEWREHERLLAERRRAREEARRAAIEGWRGKDDPKPLAPPRVGMVNSEGGTAGERTSPRETARTLVREPPAPSPERVQMQSWHGGYLVAVNEVKQALGRYIEARDAGDAADRVAACRDLDGETSRLLDDRFVLYPPDEEVGKALRSAFRKFQTTARHCVAGRAAEEAQSFTAADAALAVAGQSLASYGLGL